MQNLQTTKADIKIIHHQASTDGSALTSQIRFSHLFIPNEYFGLARKDDRKSTASFERLLQLDGRSAEDAWSIGNSLPSDINPALSLGMNAIWIPAHVWEHERREVVPHPGKLLQLESLREVESVLLGPG